MGLAMRTIFVVSMLALTLASSLSATEFHVSPEGTAKGTGSAEAPWDLTTALAPSKDVKPGDTIWLHGGTYRGGFTSRLAGTTKAPIVVRGVQGSRATIDTNPRDERDNGHLLLQGQDVVYRDFEVTCSGSQRETKVAGPWPEDIRRGVVDVRGSRISLVNLVVHDLGSGFGFWAEGDGGEISGCLIYNNGWRGPDRGHGHAVYAQNAKGTKRIVDNILFHQFGYGIHVYGSQKASLKDFEIAGNIAFHNGCLAKSGENSPGIMVGGESPAERIAIRDNTVVAGGIRLGYPWGTTNEDVVCTGNYCEQGLVVRDFRRADFSRNTVVAHSGVVQLEGAAKLLLSGHKWNHNDYYVTDGRWGECAIVEGKASRGLTFKEFKTETGFDASSTFTKGSPAALRVIVRPNAHEPGRANVAVLNPASLPEVDLDLSRVLTAGQAFRIVSAKDIFGSPLVRGVYEKRPVRVPLKAVAGAPPIGLSDVKLPVTEPQFAAFVVLPE